MLKQLFKQRVFKFLIGGGVAAGFNLLAIYILIEKLGFDTPSLQNLANVIAIELSLILSFFIYRVWVWTGGIWTIKEILFKQLPVYHLAAGAAVLTRIFLIFPILNWLGINYSINTLVGVLFSATLNYILSDRLVFPSASRKQTIQSNAELHHPEGLAPALALRSPNPQPKPPESHQPIELFSLVIPAHNEEESIGNTLQYISQVLSLENIPYEILVVNDRSRDRTESILQTIVAQNPQIRYLNNYYPNGFGFAVRCGLENFRGDAVAIVMSDSSDSPENIIDYYRKLQEGYECVFGSRFIKGGKVIDYPIHKLWVNRLANQFVSTLFNLKYNDTTNAFKAYRREVIEGIFPLVSHHFNLTVEMPLKAIVRGYSHTIVPITWQNRKTGVSKLKLQEMGSRYLFIVLYILLEKLLSKGDYVRQNSDARLLQLNKNGQVIRENSAEISQN
ncbi:glycosyltransferase [Lusitaniella coriacea]|uniref:glycosyltransferase n=1 Tax=Lusitaniella coriacea TaxID=1983105 RepID=UPI003CF1F6C6